MVGKDAFEKGYGEKLQNSMSYICLSTPDVAVSITYSGP